MNFTAICSAFGWPLSSRPPAERERWDRYHEEVCRIQGAQIRVLYLEAPDGKSHLELIEYFSPKVPIPPRRRIHEPGTTIIALEVKGSKVAVDRLRAAAVEVLSDPVPYTTDDGVSSYTTYFYDPDGNALCLFEIVEDD